MIIAKKKKKKKNCSFFSVFTNELAKDASVDFAE